jgi:hypothetical protein
LIMNRREHARKHQAIEMGMPIAEVAAELT